MPDDPSPSSPPPARRAAVTFILVTVMLDVLAIGIIVPVLPKLVLGFLGGSFGHGAKIYGLFGLAWALMQFVFAPLLGALSDRVGRRPVVLISNFGLSADYVLMALAPNIAWLFVGRLISGITAASIPTAMAYIADVTPPEKRAASFGLIGAAFGVGFTLGPALGGMVGQVDPRLPFWVAAALGLVNACYGYWVLPESLPPERRTAFSWRRANPVGSLRLLRAHTGLLGLAGVSFLCYLANEVYPHVFVLYTTHRFHWDERTQGWTFCAVGICTALMQIFLTRAAITRVGERYAILLGLLSGALGFLVYGAATTSLWFWVAIPVIAPWGVANAAIQSLMSRQIGPTEQGMLQGALGSVRGITGLIGPMLFTSTFAAFIPGGAAAARGWRVPGAPFLLSAALIFAALLTAWLTTRGKREAAPPAEATLAAPPGFVSEVP